MDVVLDSVLHFLQHFLESLFDFFVGSFSRSRYDDRPALFGRKGQPYASTFCVAFAATLPDKLGGFLVRQFVLGSLDGKLPLLVGVFEFRLLIGCPGRNFAGIDAVADVLRQPQ